MCPLCLPSQWSYICREMKISFFPQKDGDVLHIKSEVFKKNQLWNIALSFHDRLAERGRKGKKRGTSVPRHKAAERFIYICLCLPGDVHHILGGDLKAPSRSALHITPVCLSPPHDFRGKRTWGAGLGGDWQQPLESQQQWQAREWCSPVTPETKPVPNKCQKHRNHGGYFSVSFLFPFTYKNKCNF